MYVANDHHGIAECFLSIQKERVEKDQIVEETVPQDAQIQHGSLDLVS